MDTTPLLRQLGEAILRETRARIAGGPAGRAAAAIILESVTATQVVLRADPPASVLMTGWPQQQMTWLVGKRVRFIPPGQSAPIIRTVSAASLARGAWVRPARAPQDAFGAAWQSAGVQQMAQQVATQIAATLEAASTSSSSVTVWASPP